MMGLLRAIEEAAREYLLDLLAGAAVLLLFGVVFGALAGALWLGVVWGWQAVTWLGGLG
jgi:hypothetical protein